MGCAASRPELDDLPLQLPYPQLDSYPPHGRAISMPAVPAHNSSLLHDFNIVPLSADTYGINMQPGEPTSEKRFVTAAGLGGSPQRLEGKDSMEHMLQVLESLGMGNGDGNAAHTKRADQVSSILEDLKPGLERHFNQALGKPFRAVSAPLSGKENAMPAESSAQSEGTGVCTAPKGSSSPDATVQSRKGVTSQGSTVKSPKPKSRFATRILKRSSNSLRQQEHGRDCPKANADDDSSTTPALESNGSLLFDADFLASYESALKEHTPEEWNMSKDEANQRQPDNSAAKEEEEEVAEVSTKPQQVLKKRIDPLEKFEKLCPPGGENGVVLYTTSLRGIRKTFEDCNSLRGLLESFQVVVDERDVAMHQGFRSELREMMGNNPVSVPRLFIKGRYIGGADDVLQLHEEENFAALLEGLPQDRRDPANPCDGCGGARFVPCLECSGGRKVVDPDNAKEVIRCPDCNENGLIQCPICS